MNDEAESTGVAGIRLDDGTLLFVDGVPRRPGAGDLVSCLYDGAARYGTVAILPSQVLWRDPDARCATFVEAAAGPASAENRGALRQPLAILTSDVDSPAEDEARRMLACAWNEIERLDTP